MRVLLISFFYVMLLIVGADNNMGEEYQKASALDWWKAINLFDDAKYVAQQMTLPPIKLTLTQPDDTDIENLYKALDVSPPMIEDQVWFLPLLPQDHDILGYEGKINNRAFRVIPDLWKEKINLQSKDVSDVSIAVWCTCCTSHEDAKKALIRRIISGNKAEYEYLQLYKIEKGPGDFCLVDVQGPHPMFWPESVKTYVMNDSRLAFVRGNVAVYMWSYYKDFGCMDLACRIDAFLVEQMKKQKQEKDLELKDNKIE